MKRLEQNVAVITGGGRGIGRAIARRLANEGSSIVIADIASELAAEAAAECVAAGVSAIGFAVDITDSAQVDELFARCQRELETPTILVNNAGIGVPGALLEFSETDWHRQLNVNLKGSFLCMQAAARMMVSNGGGKIVSIASTAAFVSSTQLAEVAYDVSKAGIRQMTVSAAYELAPYGINVNAVAPGQILTELTREAMSDPERRARAVSKIPLGRLGKPEDVAAAVHFLCSSDADYVTGHTLVVDGGWLTH